MISSEAVPFFKTGGLADVVGDLSVELKKHLVDVRVIVPSYSKVFGEKPINVTIDVIGGSREVEVRQIIHKKVIFYFVCDPLFTEKKGIYGDTSFTPYANNFLRFTILNKVALQLCKTIDWFPEIMHCHDWTAGLLPYFVKKDETFRNTRTLFTIHNLAYQGTFSKMEFLQAKVEIDRDLFFNEQVNMLRMGLVYSNYISTVSPTYAKEIQTKDFGCGLEDILIQKKGRLFGILNAIDTKAWDPQTDQFLPFNYSKDDLENKKKIKAEVQKRFGLEVKDEVPLFTMVTRLASQKGIKQLLEAFDPILKNNDSQFLIVGTGDAQYETALKELEAKYKNLKVQLVFSNEIAHLAEAAGDYFLMPSLYEPCGLNQMFSLRYGTLPIAGKTGGLSDSIVDLVKDEQKGTGFLFTPVTSEAIIKVVEKAISIYNSEAFLRAQKNAMQKDFSWEASEKEYVKLYKKIIKEA